MFPSWSLGTIKEPVFQIWLYIANSINPWKYSVAPSMGSWYHGTMRVIAKRTLREFWEKHSSARQPLLSWYKAAQTARWQNSAELKEQFSTASIINATRVVFNIGGNTYRLVCIVRFDKQLIFVRFVGTHQQYDKINAAEV